MSSPLPNGWSPSAQVPLMFGQIVSCGIAGDERSGALTQPLFGSGASLRMGFSLPSAQTSIQIAVCSMRQGNPSAPLVVDVYSNNGGALGSLLASQPIPPSGVAQPDSNGDPGWTAFVTLGGSFPAGLLWCVVSSPAATTEADSYLVFFNTVSSWISPTAKAVYTPPPGYGGNSGSSSIWVEDSSGATLFLMPFGLTSAVNLVPVTTWVADSDYSINILAPWLSDWEAYVGGATGKFVLTDLTTGSVLGSASATQLFNSHGIQGVTPCQMPAVVDILEGHEYQIAVGQENIGAFLEGLIRASVVNPASAGPGGVAAYWFGGIALGDFSQNRVLDYGGPTTITGQNDHGIIGGATGQDWVAIRYLPTANDTLLTYSVKTKSTALTSTSVLRPSAFYPSGTPVTATVYGSAESANDAEPSSAIASPVTIDMGTVPLDGWMTFSGLSYAMKAGTPFWVVIKAPTATLANSIDLQRNVSPWRFIVDGSVPKASPNAGASWQFFGQGPTELTWKATTASGATLGNPFDDAVPLPVSSTEFVAQPFLLEQATTLTSVFAFQNTGKGFNGVLQVDIWPDNGSTTSPGPDMSGSPVSSGSFSSALMYFYSGGFIPLATPAVLAAGKWWKVYSSVAGAQVTVAYYWTRPTDPPVAEGLECLVSSNGGGSWAQYAGGAEVATTLFALGAAVVGTGPPPSATTITVKVVPSG